MKNIFSIIFLIKWGMWQVLNQEIWVEEENEICFYSPKIYYNSRRINRGKGNIDIEASAFLYSSFYFIEKFFSEFTNKPFK